MAMSGRAIWDLLTNTFSEWNEHKAPRLAAALAFYTMFTLAPLLIVAIAVAGLAFGEQAARGQIIGQIQGLVGAESAQAIQNFLEQVNAPKSNLVATVVGLGALLLGEWWVFGELQDALNTIWGVAPKPGRSLMGVLKDRFWSFALVVGVGFVLVVSLALSAWLTMVGTYFGHLLPLPTVLLEAINFAISLAVITGLFALTFKLLPDVTVAWRDVWLGA